MGTTRTAVIIWLAFSLLVVGCGRQSDPASGRLIVRSEPGGQAEIFLNGRRQIQKTNAVFADLEPGSYHVEIVRAAPDTSSPPELGEATVEVEPGRTARVVINMNRMTIVPVTENRAVRPVSRSQKSVFDFYNALSAGEFARAFAYLGTEAKRAHGGLKGFTKTWAPVDSIKITGIDTLSYDSSAALEVNEVALEIFETTETSSPTPAPKHVSFAITASEEDFGNSGLPVIIELRELTATGGRSD